MQTNEHYYSLTKDEYRSLSLEQQELLQNIQQEAKGLVRKAYTALAEVIVAEESAKG